MSDDDLLDELTLIQGKLEREDPPAARVIARAVARLAVVATGISLANNFALVYNGEDGE